MTQKGDISMVPFVLSISNVRQSHIAEPFSFGPAFNWLTRTVASQKSR